MWNLAFLFLFILHADGKSSNLCRMNPPRCDGDKLIEVDVVRCIKPADPSMWSINEITIQQTCHGVNVCDIDKLVSAVESCCGDPDYKLTKRPKLRFAYECVQGVQGDAVTTRATTLLPKMPSTTPSIPIGNAVTPKQMAGSVDVDNFCVTKMCQQTPYCSAGTEIAVMKISDSLEAEQMMNSLTYYCNKRQRCTEEYQPYVDNKCRSEDHMQLHYVCMKEKVTTTVTCDFEETIDNQEGQIRSSDYPNMIPAGTSNCRIKILFNTLSNLELFLLDLPEMEVVYKNEYSEWSSTMYVSDRHTIISPASEVLLSVNFDKLPQRRIWMYYRVFPAGYQSSGPTDLPWTSTCQDHMTTPGPMNMTSPKSNPSTPEPSKVTMFKLPSSTNPSKDMHMTHKTKSMQVPDELSTAPHIVIPDGIPVETDVVDKMEPATVPVMPPTAGSTSISPSINSGSDVSPVETPPKNPTHRENRERVSSVSDTPTTGLYSREVVIGLIAGVVILACLVIILLTALVASMRRRRRSLADGEERDERHNSGPGGTTNENLVSFQYLKTLPPDGDNVTLGTRSQQSEHNSPGGDSTSKKSLISKPIKKKNSLAPSENGSSKTADTISSKDDSVFHCLKNTDDYSNLLNESNKSTMTKNDNSFKSRQDVDDSKPLEKHEGKSLEDDVFKDVPHFYVNGDDYALVQKDSSRSPRSTLISDKPSIYANTSPRPKSGSSGSTQDSDVLEWTKGFNLAV